MNTSSDLSDSMSVGQTLSAPLLSNLLEHEGDECDADYYDEEEGCMSCPLNIVVSTKELEEVSGDDSSQHSWWNGNCVTWVVLYALLFLQLGTALYMPGAEHTTTTGLHWPMVNYGIVLFVGIAILYHKTVKNNKLTCLVVLLAPEILVIFILGLVILDQLNAAFLLMMGSILWLAVFVAVINIRDLITTSGCVEEDTDDCKQLQGKLNASLFKGGL